MDADCLPIWVVRKRGQAAICGALERAGDQRYVK
jgi:hypothetical protein